MDSISPISETFNFERLKCGLLLQFVDIIGVFKKICPSLQDEKYTGWVFLHGKPSTNFHIPNLMASNVSLLKFSIYKYL